MHAATANESALLARARSSNAGWRTGIIDVGDHRIVDHRRAHGDEQIVTDLTSLSDDWVLRSYEDIRAHVMTDIQTGGAYRFMGEAAKDRANTLLAEIQRRGLTVTPIYWAD